MQDKGQPKKKIKLRILFSENNDYFCLIPVLVMEFEPLKPLPCFIVNLVAKIIDVLELKTY